MYELKYHVTALLPIDLSYPTQCINFIITHIYFTSEFSESLLEMGSCLLDKTAIHDDGESGM